MQSLRPYVVVIHQTKTYVNNYFGGRGEIRTHDFPDLQSDPLGHSSTRPIKKTLRDSMSGGFWFSYHVR